jgi:hypothetical protein
MSLVTEKIPNKTLPIYKCGLLTFLLLPYIEPDEDAEVPQYYFPYRVFRTDGITPTEEDVTSLVPVVKFILQPTEGEA